MTFRWLRNSINGSTTATASTAIPSTAEASPTRPTEVFTPSTPAEKGFVARTQEGRDLKQKGLNVPGTQIVVWGESGAGKSSLVNKALEESGRTAVKTVCMPDSSFDDVLKAAFAGTGAFYISETSAHADSTLSITGTVGSDLIGAKMEFTGERAIGVNAMRSPITAPQINAQTLLRELGTRNWSWVLEDFHKAPAATRAAISHSLKTFSDDGQKYPHTTVIILGVSDSVDELFGGEANLPGRLIDIPVAPLTKEQLGGILDLGEKLLNVDFSKVRKDLLDTSVGLASITHTLALNCCDERELTERSSERITFTQDDYTKAVQAYSRTRSGRVRARFSKALVAHRTRKFANTVLILQALASLPESGASHNEILQKIRESEVEYPSSNLTKYLVELQSDERGSVVRKSSNKFRFDEPLLHAYAKLEFRSRAEPNGASAIEPATVSIPLEQATQAFDAMVSELSQELSRTSGARDSEISRNIDGQIVTAADAINRARIEASRGEGNETEDDGEDNRWMLRGNSAS